MIWAILALLSPSQQTPTFRAEARIVHVDVFVTRDGRPVPNLTAEDFVLRDNGVTQTKLSLLDLDDAPLSVMLVFDTSGSVYGAKLENLRSAAHELVDQLRPVDEVGLLTFGSGLESKSPLSARLDSVHRAIDRPVEGGRTALRDAIAAATIRVEGGRGRPLLIVFSDGEDNASWLTASRLADVLTTTEAVLFAATMSAAEKGRGELETATAATSGRVLTVDRVSDLKTAFLAILREMRTRYVLYYQPEAVSQEGWHDLEVELREGLEADVRARPGYYPGARVR